MNNKLKESLDFVDVFFISLGSIVGAGVYSLIYLVTAYGGKYTWLSFIIGGIISLFTALSYSDLSAHFDTTASDYDYITVGLTPKLKYILAIILIGIGIMVCSTLSFAFSNIVKKNFKKLNYNIILILTIMIPTIINIYGVKTTSNINMGISIIGITTLIILITLCCNKKGLSLVDQKGGDSFDYKGILYGGFMSVFAYSGFEVIPKLADETKNSKKNIPIAIISSLLLTIIIYTLVSMSINNILGVKKVINTVNPITDAYSVFFGKKFNNIINIITLLSIFNTISVTILFTSRQLFGLSIRDVIPKVFSKIHKTTYTPRISILFVSMASLLVCLYSNIEKTSHISNTLLFILFILINLSAINLAYNGKIATTGLIFKSKRKVGNIPIYSVLGFISSIIVLSFIK